MKAPAYQVSHVTEESQNRTKLAQESIRRRSEKTSLSREEWLYSLGLVAELEFVNTVEHPKFKRAFELLNKTNQFNTTGKRWESGELDGLFGQGGRILTVSVSDKSINNGLTGVIVIRDDTIVQAVLSCRVFGLGVEDVMTSAAVVSILEHHQAAKALLTDTGKNFTCHDHFKRFGFDEDKGVWRISSQGVSPKWIVLK